jgi:valyl-tRNA synthetase
METPNPLPTRYDPAKVEERWYAHWLEKGHFNSEPRPEKKPYTIVIPPPNVTGALHMGHALNNTLQDILIRWRRMQGYETLWMPGTDHAGIATQAVVEKQIAKTEKKTRQEIGREAFLERVWDWREKYGNRILLQLRKLGCSCDWRRTRFTLDEGLSRAVREVFVLLYRRGLIYRGVRLVNWCPKLRTAISDDEVEHQEVRGHLWYIRYPAADVPSRSVTVATTRPETMLGDTAVAVHPQDERYKDLVGKMLVLPLMERKIPVIADPAVDRSFGTGAVKVTPAHDPADFDMGERHGLEKINILNVDGTINENGGPYAGLPRFKARDRVVEDLQARGLLENVQDYTHQVGHCSRTGDVIEPYLSLQWFVRMRPLAEKAMKATASGRVKFHPERYTSYYNQWLENVRDWCVSRQLWWGHQIPIWYAPDGTPFCGHSEAEARSEAEKKFGAGVALERDPDVLDTWFSSALWPFSTLGWPDETPELKYYYPTSVLVTARDIIFFWVARMVMMSEEILGEEPFSHVYINGTIMDKVGKRMSKSLGNGIDPVAMIDGGVDENSGLTYEPHGADGVRFSLTTLSTEGQDLKLWPARFEDGQRFLTKLWNAARFALGHFDAGAVAPRVAARDLRTEDSWILDRLASAVEETTDFLETFRYCDAAQRIRSFVWDDFCDWYVEAAKFRFQDPVSPEAASCRRVLAHVLDTTLRLLHPLCPFITEELWHLLGEKVKDRSLGGDGTFPSDSVIVAPWPDALTRAKAPVPAETFSWIQDIVRLVRKIRQERNISAAETPDVLLAFSSAEASERVAREGQLLRDLAKVREVTFRKDATRPSSCAVEVLPGIEVIVPLPAKDTAKELKALEKKKTDLETYIQREESKLAKPSFREKAPKDVVDAALKRVQDAVDQLKKVEVEIRRVSGG